MARVKEYLINISPIPWKKPDQYEHSFDSRYQNDRTRFEIYLQNIHGDEPAFNSPVKMDVTFFMPIPKSICRRKPSSWHYGIPHLDNLQRFLIYAINQSGVIWRHDRLLSCVNVKKVYDKEPRTHFVISELE